MLPYNWLPSLIFYFPLSPLSPLPTLFNYSSQIVNLLTGFRLTLKYLLFTIWHEKSKNPRQRDQMLASNSIRKRMNFPDNSPPPALLQQRTQLSWQVYTVASRILGKITALFLPLSAWIGPSSHRKGNPQGENFLISLRLNLLYPETKMCDISSIIVLPSVMVNSHKQW